MVYFWKMERLEALISGRVQMVMYRDFVMRKARGLALTGYVRNLRDGTVEVVAEGTRTNLEAFVEKLRKGPLLAKVENVSTSFLPATGAYTSFLIRYD